MSASAVTQVSAGWAPLAAALLLAVAGGAAAGDAALTAHAEGRPWRVGLATPWAETARLFRQRRRRTVAADVALWRIGAAGLFVVAMLMVVVIPLGRWTIGDLSVGIVWFNAMDVLVWAVVWLAGWGANSAHALVAGYRFLSQALSYELPLMFALTAPAVGAGSLRVGDVVAAQSGLWFVVWMPAAFLIFCAAVLAFSVWGPFSAATGVSDAGGVLAESSGIDRWLLLAGRWALLTAGAAFATAMFLGAGGGPLLPDWLWMPAKTAVLLAVFVLLRRRLPVVRPERLTEVAWMVALPLVLLQVLIVSVVVVGRS